MKSPFSKAFEEHTINTWSDRSKINQVESYLLSNYFKDKNTSILDAGTGNGVFSFYLEKELGFQNISAFDIIPKMIERAKKNATEKTSNVNFFVADAAQLHDVKSNQFGYLCYLQQVLSMVPEHSLNAALKEAHRIGNEHSTYLFSFLDWHSRWYNPILSLNINTVRLLKGKPVQKRYLPELKFNGKLNKQFYKSDQHAMLWAKKRDILKTLNNTGFEVKTVYKEKMITNKKGRALFFVCTKK